MKPLPLPLRVAAGLAVITAERVRELPKQLTGLPVTVVSQVLQFSMRVQQHVTEIAIKGDDALSGLRPIEDTPSWATFDEDLPDLTIPASITRLPVPPPDADVPAPRAETNGHKPALPDLEDELSDPWADEERALAEDHADGEFDSAETSETGDGPAGLSGYDELTLPQLRARLRRFSLAQLEELLTYERANANRASFIGMLARRIGNVEKAGQDEGDGADGR
ncbi:lipid droplet-associated protein [Amycolatopsis sp. H20-H5]|uniref:lipid droplet-associated protein n=1 Tax=Amycolatopsis sp. H20-H5 TaxID=3046309 RepID=UPI002DBA9BBA|nr:lipid droplet-associated protein [Amycolatopsis sp. H20-H5]MEC3981353.1 lipid droplet-associated protein [Amycolatopsis sp. H20-H5]